MGERSRFMNRSLRVLMMLSLSIFVVFAGCAKRPVIGQAAAPPPTGAAAPVEQAPVAAAPEPVQPSAAPATPTPAERPAPKDFAAVPELQAIHFDFDKSDIRAQD